MAPVVGVEFLDEDGDICGPLAKDVDHDLSHTRDQLSLLLLWRWLLALSQLDRDEWHVLQRLGSRWGLEGGFYGTCFPRRVVALPVV